MEALVFPQIFQAASVIFASDLTPDQRFVATGLCITIGGIILAVARNLLFLARVQAPWAHFPFKVLPTLCFGLLAYLATMDPARFPNVQVGASFTVVAVGAYLFFALGDFALLQRQTAWFLAGLGFFLVGHLGIALVFFWVVGSLSWVWLFLALGAGGVLLWQYKIAQAKMLGAVAAYILVIALMIGIAGAFGLDAHRSMIIPAVMFAASDSIIGWQRFRARLPGGEYWVWNLYWVAIFSFAALLPLTPQG